MVAPYYQHAGIEWYQGDRRLVRLGGVRDNGGTPNHAFTGRSESVRQWPAGVTDKRWEVSDLVALLEGAESKKAA